MTLCDVARSYQPKNNVELTLKCLLSNIVKKFENDNCELPEMLKILKGDLEAKELFQSEVPTVKNLQTDTHHLRYILVLKVF